MSKLTLSMAVGNYDRIRPLIDGTVKIDGVDPIFMNLEPEEIFFRAFRNAEFDVCELSLSSFSVKQAAGQNPYVGIPVFPSRMFRHSAFYVRPQSGIKTPEDLRGRRIGLPEYQLTACVWARVVLEEHGVKPSDIRWVRGGLEQPGRDEKIALNLPGDVTLEDAPTDTTLSEMLKRGDIDGIIAPRAPKAFERGDADIAWLFPDPQKAGRAYYEKTRIFPIMHLLGVRRALAEQHPWLPGALLKSFTQAKDIAVAALFDAAASKVSLPFLEETARATAAFMGPDFWSYGIEANRKVLDTFLHHHHAQGLSAKRLTVEDLFHPHTRESFKI